MGLAASPASSSSAVAVRRPAAPTSLLARLAAPLALVLLTAACAGTRPDARAPATRADSGIDPARAALAEQLAQDTRARGLRLWCVPFARALSGVTLKGDARHWWAGAEGVYARGKLPQPGAVMAFAATSRMPSGHVAVVSQVVSEREILLDHANWERNEVSLGMRAVDVSKAGDWSQVRLESRPGVTGRVNPINGFIYPQTAG